MGYWVHQHNYQIKAIGNNSYHGYIAHGVQVNYRVSVEPTLDLTTDDFILRGLTKSGKFGTHELDCNRAYGTIGKGVYQIRLKRTDHGTSHALGTSDAMNLNSVTEIVNGDFSYPNTALLGFRIRADDQLAGQPPNINVMVRGTKVAVPNLSGSEDFDDMYWNTASLQWQNVSGSVVRTWDETTWNSDQEDKEFSDNFILVTRDLLLNDRYGLGKYITTSNLNEDGLVPAIKECHKAYNILETTDNMFEWWDVVASNMWQKYISFEGDLNTNANITLDKANTNIIINTTASSTSGVYYRTKDSSFAQVVITSLETLKRDKNYTFAASIDSVTDPISRFCTFVDNPDGTWRRVDETLNLGNGNYTFDIDTTTNKSSRFMFKIERNDSENATNMSSTICRITDVGLSWKNTKYDHYHTFDGVIETSQSALSVLLEMCAGYRSWPIWESGGLNIIMDTDTTPIHTLSMNNIIEFNQSFTPLSEIPSRVSAQFSNESDDFDQNIIQVISSDTNLNELNEVVVGLKGITDIRKAEREALWKLNKVTNCTHIVQVTCGIDTLHAISGDIINVQHDLPSWGHGGMILDYNSVNSSIIIDAPYNFTATNLTASYLIKYQKDNNVFVTATLDVAATGSTQQLTVTNWVGSPCDDSTYALGNSNNYVKPFRIMQTARTSENEIEAVLLEHVASLYSSEPTLSYKDITTYSTLPNKLAIPPPPEACNVLQTTISEGLGFKVIAGFPNTNVEIKDIVVEMSESILMDKEWETIAIIPKGQKSAVYLNPQLKTDSPHNLYSFRFACRTNFKKSSYVMFNNIVLDKQAYSIAAPTGLHVKYNDPLDVDDESRFRWDGNDITFVWNPAGMGIESYVKGYKLKIYHDSISEANLLAVRQTASTEYTYFQDTSPYYAHLIVELFTVSVFNTESVPPTREQFINTVPSIPANIAASPLEDGVKFMWDLNPEVDVVGYNYRTRVNTDDWSSWNSIDVNGIVRNLTNYEVAAQAYSRSNIAVQVKALDKYDNISATSAIASIDCYNFKPEITVSPTAGLGHFTTIASAVNAASVSGGKILLKEGTYALANVYMPNVNLTIEGINKELVIINKEADADGFKIFSTSETFDSTFNFKNFTFNASDSDWYSRSIDIGRPNETYNVNADIIIDNVVFNASTFDGTVHVYSESTNGSMLFNCYVTDCDITGGQDGIRLENMNGDVIVSDNIFDNIKYHCIYVIGGANIELVDNILNNTNYYGLVVEKPSDYVRIENNTLTFNDTDRVNGSPWGIRLYSGKNFSIKNNSVTFDRFLNNISILRGIDYDGTNNTYTYNVVSNNTINITASGCSSIIGIEQHFGAPTSGALVNDNNITIDGSLSSNTGLRLRSGSESCAVSNNFINMVNNTASDAGIAVVYSNGHYGGGNIIQNAGIGIYTLSGSHQITATYITT